MKNTINPLKTTVRSKIVPFLIPHCNAQKYQISYFHLFQGRVIPLLRHLAPWPDFRLQLLFARSDSWRLAPIFLSVTWKRWVYTVISKVYWKLKHGFTHLTLLRYSHWHSIHLKNSTQLCARPHMRWWHIPPHGMRSDFLWSSFPVLAS